MEAVFMGTDCPLDVLGVSVANRGVRNRAEITVLNHACHTVSGIEAVMKWRVEGMECAMARPVHCRDLRVRNESCITVDLPGSGRIRTDSVSVTLLRVEYEDGTPCWNLRNQ